jgi:hypothetical protein
LIWLREYRGEDMAVGSYTYGTVAGVTRKIGWTVPSRTFTGSTVPTTTEVELTLDQIAADILVHLTNAGYPIKTKTEMTALAARVCEWLGDLNEMGASATLLMGFVISNDSRTGSNSPEKFWRDHYEAGLKMIDGGSITNLGLSKGSEMSDLLVCTSLLDEDGNEKYPLFTRDMFEIQPRTNTKQSTEYADA